MHLTRSCGSRCSKEESQKLLVFGNPLLDITVQVKNNELLQKYNLEKNGQKEVPLEMLGKLIGDAKARYTTFSCRGSCRTIDSTT